MSNSASDINRKWPFCEKETKLFDAGHRTHTSTKMPGDLIITLCLNGQGDFVESFQIPYDITWADLEEMLKAQLDAERIAVSYIDADNDEISIGSQEELFEAFRVAMRAKDTLQLKVMTLTAETAVFRMPDDDVHEEPEELQEPLDLRQISPDPSVAIPMPYTEKEQDIDRVENTVVSEPAAPEPAPAPGSAQMTIVMPDCDQQCVITENSVQWQNVASDIKPRLFQVEPDEGSPVDTEKGSPVDIATDPEEEESLSCRSDQLLAYSDFVTFMTKLKKELRCEIVRDVTRKTVKQVLKGLDGAVIESLQGSSLLAQGSVAAGSMGSVRSSLKGEHPVYVHDGVLCDNCNNVIVGPRYKCGNCLDFDLCETCESKAGIHNPDHIFVKIRRPCYRPGVQDGVRKPLLKTEIYKTHRKCGTKLVVPILGETTENENELNFRLESKMKDIFARNEDKRRKKDEKKLEKLKKKEEKLKRRMECRNDAPPKRERLELLDNDNTVRYDFYKVLMGVEVLACLNMPDGTRVQPDTKFTKTWQVKNSGDGPWSESTKLRLLWGNISVTEPEQEVPFLKPGEQGEITVSCISPAEPGEYQSHWKLYEHSMGFGSRIWCSIVVVPRETLEPTAEEKDSLKVVTETFEKLEMEDTEAKPEQAEPMKEIKYKAIEDEEHLREVVVTWEEKLETSQQEAAAAGTSQPEAGDETSQEPADDTTQQEASDRTSMRAEAGNSLVVVDETSQQEADEGISRQEVRSEDDVSMTGEGYVVYARCGEGDVFEVPDTKNVKSMEESQSIADDLTSAVARLTLESEPGTGTDKASHTATPHNTPYDLTPMKTPNPEPEDLLETVAELKALSNSSSVELVPGAEHGEDQLGGETTEELVQQRMASLELRPDIDLESVSSYSDDDEDNSSLSDNDYIIVPLPDCFDISKPLNQSFSSYSTSIDRTTVSLDDNHNTLTHRESREGSVDDLFNTSVSIPTRPLSPTPSDIPSLTAGVMLEVEVKDASATSEALVKGDNAHDLPRGADTAEMQVLIASAVQEIPALQAEMIQSTGVNSSGSTPQSISSTGYAGVSSLDQGSPTEGSSESGASGAASAQSTEDQSETLEAGETTGDDTDLKEPVSASAQLPDNVQIIKSGKQKAPRSVDFAPDFANQLVTTAVNAAGQAYITAKAVFKTWQDKQQAELKSQAKSKSSASSGKSTPPTGWKPASTQWSPPSEEEFKPVKEEWKPAEPTFTPPKSDWKPPAQEFKAPKSDWKPPMEDEASGPKPQWKPSKEAEPAPKKWKPPKDFWTAPKEDGPMGQLFEMGFFDRAMNQQLLNQFNNDIEKVIQELLAKKNADWSV